MPIPSPARTLAALADDYWKTVMRHRPLSATNARFEGFDDRLEDVSAAGRKRQASDLRSLLRRLAAIAPAKLSPDDRVTHEVLKWQLEMGLERLALNFQQWGGLSTVGVDHVIGMQSWIPTVVETAQPMGSEKDVAAYLRRLKALPDFFRDHVKNLREGFKSGRTPAKVAVDRTIVQIDRMCSLKAHETPFTKPIARLPQKLRTRHETRLHAAIERYVFPAYAAYGKFLKSIAGRARSEEKPGACYIRKGKAAYDFLIRFHTTLELDADELHTIGLEELRVVHAEMRSLARRMGHEGEPSEFMAKIRADASNFFSTREEIVVWAKRLVEETYRRLPEFFGQLPKTPLEVKPIEEYKEKNDVGARYSGPPMDLSRPGIYYVNTYEPHTRSRFGMASLTAHEGVPGHHLQIALAVENKKIPAIRRYASSTAYIEGWALYAERLADEMGLYQDDLARLGMLSNQAFRAARLVVDTGLHARGWSRRKAIDFMAQNTPMSKGEIESEIDRYTVWPGQALAYMAGQRELWRLRHDLESKLGSRFDIRAFHDAVIGHGPLPLTVLRRVVSSQLGG